jgi:hypothetical protein
MQQVPPSTLLCLRNKLIVINQDRVFKGDTEAQYASGAEANKQSAMQRNVDWSTNTQSSRVLKTPQYEKEKFSLLLSDKECGCRTEHTEESA